METSKAPLFFLLNTAAGSQDAETTCAAIEQTMAGSNRGYRLITIGAQDNTEARIKTAVDSACAAKAIVVAAGGDGTISSVAQQLLNSPSPLGVLPGGTFNYFARSVGMAADTQTAVQQILQSAATPIQAGMVNGHVFLVNASLGLHPQMLVDREAFKTKLGRHRFVAILAGLFTLAQQPHHLRLRLTDNNGETSIQTPLLFVGNNPLQLHQLGLDLRRTTKHTPTLTDGLLAVVLKHASSMQLFRLALRGALGTLGEDECLSLSSFKRLLVQPRPPWRYRTVKVALDGEIKRMRTPLHFEVAPDALTVMVPPPWAPPAANEAQKS
ncbi:MAG: diacylglycerol kinase [Desulfobulbaceae bacterium]|nr:diacylglycerol kinase [Desulfobulbaceae bacterium]